MNKLTKAQIQDIKKSTDIYNSFIQLIRHGRELYHSPNHNTNWGNHIIGLLTLLDEEGHDIGEFDWVQDMIKKTQDIVILFTEEGEEDSRVWKSHKYYDQFIKENDAKLTKELKNKQEIKEEIEKEIELQSKTKTKPIYETCLDNIKGREDCEGWDRHTGPADCHGCGGKNYNCPATFDENKCTHKQLVGFE